MTISEVEGRFFKNFNKSITQYSYYLSYKVSYVDEVTNKKTTITRHSRVGCTYYKNDEFLFFIKPEMKMFDDSEWTFSEITEHEWKRKMIKAAIRFGKINDDIGFFEAIEHIK